MSAAVPCTCGVRNDWVVAQYKSNHSAFSGYHYTPSAYSEVRCTNCNGRWRTKAKYVEELPHE